MDHDRARLPRHRLQAVAARCLCWWAAHESTASTTPTASTRRSTVNAMPGARPARIRRPDIQRVTYSKPAWFGVDAPSFYMRTRAIPGVR